LARSAITPYLFQTASNTANFTKAQPLKKWPEVDPLQKEVAFRDGFTDIPRSQEQNGV